MTAKKILKVKEYTLKDGDSMEKIATDNNLTKKQLLKFNFGVETDKDFKQFLWGRLGCRKMNDDGTLKFEGTDTPGKIFIPIKETKLTFASNSSNQVKLKHLKVDIKAPTKCIVKFRPPAGWKGKFGFDWVRQADTGMPGDLAYKDNMSAATPYASLRAMYRSFIIPKALNDGKDALNHPAYLNLFPADECPNDISSVDLKVKIDRRGDEPASLSFESNLPNYKDFITIDESLPKSTGEYPLKVTCKKACDQEIILTVMNNTNDANGRAEKLEVGKLIIPRNDKANRPTLNVVFVPVWTNINGPVKKISPAFISEMKTLLKDHCAQALIHTKYETQKFDLTAGFFRKVGIKLKNTFKIGLNPVEQFNYEWVVGSPVGDGSQVIFTDYYDRLYTNGRRIMLHSLLVDAFKKKYPKFNEYYPVFMFDENGYAIDAPTPPATDLDFVGLCGVADDIPGTSVIVFGDQDKSTVSHELFHALGLSHPFDSGSALKFKNHGTGGETYCRTDNIMDYSHFVKPVPIEMFETWHWQWDILKNTLKNKTWP